MRSPKRIQGHTEPFHYCLPLRFPLLELFGSDSKWENSAGGFGNPRCVREALLAAAKKLRARTQQVITADDRLLLITSLALDQLETEAKQLTQTSNNQLEIIAALLTLVAGLLGFDWFLGKPNRHVIYYQTLEQQQLDDRRGHPDHAGNAAITEFWKRVEVVARLHDEGFRPPQIARTLLMSEHLVKQLLVRSGRLARNSNIKAD